MSKKKRWYGLGLLVLLYTGFPLVLIFQKQQIIQYGQRVVMTSSYSQPQSSYRGQFYEVQLPDAIPFSSIVKPGQKLFLQFNTDGTIADLSTTRPSHNWYVKADVRYQENETVFLNYPFSLRTVFDTQHIPDSIRQDWDKWMMDPYETVPPKIKVEAFLYQGHGRTTMLLIDE